MVKDRAVAIAFGFLAFALQGRKSLQTKPALVWPKHSKTLAFLSIRPQARSGPIASRIRLELDSGVAVGMTKQEQPPPSSLLEIEQKFSLVDRDKASIERKLMELGFQKREDLDLVMVDWYFDHPAAMELMEQDCWLRYRYSPRKNAGQWQLKRGKQQHAKAGGVTVYEEIEGSDAIAVACTLLSTSKSPPAKVETSETVTSQISLSHLGDDDNSLVAILDQPPEILNAGLVAFATIVTRRSSWKNSKKSASGAALDLSVDLDTANRGYAVGEVEVLVPKDDPVQVEAAREQIQNFLLQLLDGDVEAASTPAEGKLEYFLKEAEPAIYRLGLKYGVIKERSK